MNKAIETGISWIFDEYGPSSITEDAEIIRQSFRGMEIPGSLVREAIQNSLDARLPGKKLNMVFSFGQILKKKLDRYYKTLIPHLEARRIGQDRRVLGEEDLHLIHIKNIVKLLSIEDLNTTGLEGDTTSHGVDSGSQFSTFFFAEGLSPKQGTKGGRWGQGKTTFNMASKINSFWGLTIRHSDSEEYLMGKAFLSPHLMNGKRYRHHGLYLTKDHLPISDPIFIKDFKKNMNCLRDSSESGLSIIIPYPEDELTLDSILKAVIMNYFFPIIKEDLTVKIRGEDGNFHDISNNSIYKLAESLDWRGTGWEKPKEEDDLEILKFSKECIDLINNDELINLSPKIAYSLNITEEFLEETINIGEKMLQFNQGKILGFRVPVNIKKKDGTEELSNFEVFIKKYPDGIMSSSDEHYFRSGLSLPKESAKRNLGGLPVRSLLNAEDAAVSEFLGDAEDPNHLQWVIRTEELRRKYIDYYPTLSFIRYAPRKIVQILDIKTRERDYDLLNHIFYIPEEKKPEEKQKIKSEGKESEGPPEDSIPPSIKNIFIEKISNGVLIRSKLKRYEYPIHLRLKIAYDVIRGSPFRYYNVLDFDLNSKLMNIIENGCKISSINENHIDFTFKDRKSNLQIIGFDSNRDLYIDIVRVEKVES